MPNKQIEEHHKVLFSELVALVGRYAEEMTSLEVLAVAANMVGKLLAFQDQRIVDSGLALKVVSENIVLGNKEALSQFLANNFETKN